MIKFLLWLLWFIVCVAIGVFMESFLKIEAKQAYAVYGGIMGSILMCIFDL